MKEKNCKVIHKISTSKCHRCISNDLWHFIMSIILKIQKTFYKSNLQKIS